MRHFSETDAMHVSSRVSGRCAYQNDAGRSLPVRFVRTSLGRSDPGFEGKIPRELVRVLKSMANGGTQTGNLHCQRPTWWHRLLAPTVVAFFLFGDWTKAFAHEPSRVPLGPRGAIAIGTSSRLSYRDFLLDDQYSSSLRASISSRGFSASGWVSRSSDGDSSEVLLGYSHKLPLVDIHIGYARTNVDALHGHSFGSGRLTLSSNVSDRTQIDMTFDRFTDGAGELNSISVTRHLLEHSKWSVDMRAGATWWNLSAGDAEAWSVRALSRRALKPRWELDVYAGFASGRSSVMHETIEDGFIAGFGITWTK